MWTGVPPPRLWSTTRPWLTAWTSLVWRTTWRISGDSSSWWGLHGSNSCNNNHTDAFERQEVWRWPCFAGLSVWSWLVIQTLDPLCFSWFTPSPRTSASWSAVTSGPYVEELSEAFHPDRLLLSIYVRVVWLCPPSPPVSLLRCPDGQISGSCTRTAPAASAGWTKNA